MTKKFSAKKFVGDVQQDLLFYMIKDLKKGTLPYSKSKKLAQEFLEVKKSETVEDFLVHLAGLIPNYQEVHVVYLKHAPNFYARAKENKLMEIQEYVVSKDFDNAVKVAISKTYIKNQLKGRVNYV